MLLYCTLLLYHCIVTNHNGVYPLYRVNEMWTGQVQYSTVLYYEIQYCTVQSCILSWWVSIQYFDDLTHSNAIPMYLFVYKLIFQHNSKLKCIFSQGKLKSNFLKKFPRSDSDSFCSLMWLNSVNRDFKRFGWEWKVNLSQFQDQCVQLKVRSAGDLSWPLFSHNHLGFYWNHF